MNTVATLDKQEVRKMLADIFDMETDALADDARFIEDLGLDSLMALEVMVALEKHYKIKMKESDMARITCLNDVCAVILEKTQ